MSEIFFNPSLFINQNSKQQYRYRPYNYTDCPSGNSQKLTIHTTHIVRSCRHAPSIDWLPILTSTKAQHGTASMWMMMMLTLQCCCFLLICVIRQRRVLRASSIWSHWH